MRRCGLAIALLLVSYIAQAANDRALFWRASSATASVYLLGSIHVADKSFYPLRAQIEQAFDAADALVVEVDMDAAASQRFQQLVQTQGTYPAAETIRDHLSAETFAQLQQQLHDMQIPLASVERLKPGLLMVMLSAAQFTQQGLSPEQGIDIHFIAQARHSKPILELETIEQQFELLANFANGELLRML